MARCAREHQGIGKPFAPSAVKAAALLVIAAPYLIFRGVPRFGLPDAEEATNVEITYFHTAGTKTFRSPGDIKLARKAAGYCSIEYKGDIMRGPYRRGGPFVGTAGGVFRR